MFINNQLTNDCDYYCNTCDTITKKCTKCAYFNRVPIELIDGKCQEPNKLFILRTCDAYEEIKTSFTYRCVQRPTTVNPNCFFIYWRDNTCLNCKTMKNNENYYLDYKKICYNVFTVVPNCEKYIDLIHCERCINGYALRFEKCVRVISNCAEGFLINNKCYKCNLSNEYINGSQCYLSSELFKLSFIFWFLFK